MSKHTAGPWKITKNDAYEEYWVTREHWDAGPAKIIYSIEDARLIAAAPELLLNLRQLCELLESIGHDCTPAREVIAKATEGQ